MDFWPMCEAKQVKVWAHVIVSNFVAMLFDSAIMLRPVA
jgi:hypothetical protein